MYRLTHKSWRALLVDRSSSSCRSSAPRSPKPLSPWCCLRSPLAKADWKAAGAVEKALEGALGTDADLVSVSAAAAKDKKLGAKAIGCKGESPCFGKLAQALARSTRSRA